MYTLYFSGSVEYGSPTSAKRTRIEEPHPFPQSQVSITTFSAAQRQSLVGSEPTSKFPSGENGNNPSQSTTAPAPVDELFRPSATRAFLNVFRHLSPSDLAASALVSRKWRAAILSARDQLAKFPIRLIFRYNERGAAYPGFTIAKYVFAKSETDTTTASSCSANQLRKLLLKSLAKSKSFEREANSNVALTLQQQ
jgi:hypothetical protein